MGHQKFETIEDCEKTVDSLRNTLRMAKQNLAVIEDEVESTNALIDEVLEERPD